MCGRTMGVRMLFVRMASTVVVVASVWERDRDTKTQTQTRQATRRDSTASAFRNVCFEKQGRPKPKEQSKYVYLAYISSLLFPAVNLLPTAVH